MVELLALWRVRCELGGIWECGGEFVNIGLHVSKESPADEVRPHRGQPIRDRCIKAGVSLVRPGEFGALRADRGAQGGPRNGAYNPRRANESLQQTAPSGPPCERLASSSQIKHHLGWLAARRS